MILFQMSVLIVGLSFFPRFSHFSHILFKVYWVKKKKKKNVDDARKLTVEDTRSNWVIN